MTKEEQAAFDRWFNRSAFANESATPAARCAWKARGEWEREQRKELMIKRLRDSLTLTKLSSYPWQSEILKSWYIVSMIHHLMCGVKNIYVVMARDDRTIKSEGPDNEEIWKSLEKQAALHNPSQYNEEK
jgi:hypothetical protein